MGNGATIHGERADIVFIVRTIVTVQPTQGNTAALAGRLVVRNCTARHDHGGILTHIDTATGILMILFILAIPQRGFFNITGIVVIN